MSFPQFGLANLLQFKLIVFSDDSDFNKSLIISFVSSIESILIAKLCLNKNFAFFSS